MAGLGVAEGFAAGVGVSPGGTVWQVALGGGVLLLYSSCPAAPVQFQGLVKGSVNVVAVPRVFKRGAFSRKRRLGFLPHLSPIKLILFLSTAVAAE